MRLTVIFDPAADQDIENEFNYLVDRNIDVALRFFKAVGNTCDTIAEMPGMGSPRTFKNSHLKGVRMWAVKGFPKYLIFYLTTDEDITVLRVLHGARNIEHIFSDTEA